MINQGFYTAVTKMAATLESSAYEKAVLELTARAPQTDRDRKFVSEGLAAPLPLVDQIAISEVQYRIHVRASEIHPYGELPDPESFKEAKSRIDRISQLIAVTASSDASSFPDGQEKSAEYGKVTFANLSSVSLALNEWTGPAARDFRVNFIDGLATTIANNSVAIKSMGLIYAHLAQIWAKTHDSVRDHLTKAQKSIDKSLEGDVNWSVLLTATASIATLAATIPSLGLGAGVAIAGVDAVSSFVPSILSAQDEPDRTLEMKPQDRRHFEAGDPYATTAESILDETLRGLGEIVDRAVAEEKKLARELRQITSDIGGSLELFRPETPQLTAVPGQKLISPDLMGVPKIA